MTLSAYNPSTGQFAENVAGANPNAPDLTNEDLLQWMADSRAAAIPAAANALLGGSGTAGSASPVAIGSGLSLSAGTLSATVSSGGVTITGTAPIVVTGSAISVTIGSASGTVAAGNDTRIVNAEQTANKNTASGYAGLDGSAKLPLATLAAGGATTGQVLAWSGTAYAPTTPGISGVSIDGSTIVASTSSPYQMVTADRVIDVNKASGAATKIMLPSNPTLWVDYTVIDGRGDAGTNNITVAVAGGTINGVGTFVMNVNNDAFTFRAVSATTWRIS